MPPSRDAGYENVAFPESVIEARIPPRLPIPVLERSEVVEITTRGFDGARYLVWHWPWSIAGDLESHALYSFN